MLAIFFSAALGALLDAEDAKADWVWRYVAVHCRPSEAKVSIELQYESNDELTPAWHGETRFGADGGVRDQDFKVSDQIDYGECLLAPATPVRVKVLRGVAMPYGMCGGDPETWLSVWVDQRKWLSRQFLDGRCPPALISRLEVTMAGVTICSAETLGSEETCSFKPASALAREPDLAEYPTGPRGPLPGTIVTEFAADGALCSSMVRRGQDKAGRQSWQVDLPSDAKSWMFSDRPREQWEYAKGRI